MRDSHLETIQAAFACLLLAGAACSEEHSAADSPETSPARNGAAQSQLAFVPDFPGAGRSGADAPLAGGMICDSGTRVDRRLLVPRTTCFFQQGQTQPAATIERVLECVEGVDAVHLRLTFDPAFVDNSYGENAVGWGERGDRGRAGTAAPPPPPAAMPGVPGMPGDPAMGRKGPLPPPAGMMGGMSPPPMAAPGKAKGPGGRGHTWKDLVGSDHAEFVVTNEAEERVLQFKLDYISVTDDEPSGYASLGVLGGDGRMIAGDAAAVVDWRTSIERNLNERGYAEYVVDSPATDADYTPNDATPDWDYRVVYEAWVDHAAFGDSGFGGALIEHVHASPSKAPKNTIVVIPGECPCLEDGGCDQPPSSCEQNPSDPECQLL